MSIIQRALNAAAASHSDPLDAANAVCARLEQTLVLSIGADGWRTLLQRGLVEARRDEPVLRDVTVDPDGRLRWVSPPVLVEAPMTGAVASLLLAAIHVLERLVGRDLALHLLELGLLEIDDA